MSDRISVEWLDLLELVFETRYNWPSFRIGPKVKVLKNEWIEYPISGRYWCGLTPTNGTCIMF